MTSQSHALNEMKSKVENQSHEDNEKLALIKSNQKYEEALRAMQENMKILQKNQVALQENLKAHNLNFLKLSICYPKTKTAFKNDRIIQVKDHLLMNFLEKNLESKESILRIKIKT